MMETPGTKYGDSRIREDYIIPAPRSLQVNPVKFAQRGRRTTQTTK